MKIENVILELKPHLKDYLRVKLGNEVDRKTFNCYVHQENTPSMGFDPHTDNTVVHCFGCGARHDIFAAAAALEDLPKNGKEWITTTIPTLCKYFDIPFEVENLDPNTRELLKLKKFWNDFLSLAENTPLEDYAIEYLDSRSISNHLVPTISSSTETIVNALKAEGWERNYILEQISVGNGDEKLPIASEDFLSFFITDRYGSPIGLVSRNLKQDKPKYINSQESLLYKKRESLFGIHQAIQSGKTILYIVEGPGDVMAFHNIGIQNVVALCGTALSAEQLTYIKMAGFRDICLYLDNDEAGISAVKKHIYNLKNQFLGLNIYIATTFPNDAKDVNDIVHDIFTANTEQEALDTAINQYLLAIQTEALTLIDWLIGLHKEAKSSTDVMIKDILQFIAIEPTATKREYLGSILSEETDISLASILEDVDYVRKNKDKERIDRIEAATAKYIQSVSNDPLNATIHFAQHEQDLISIEQEYKKTEVGATYQVARFEALEEMLEKADPDSTNFKLTRFKGFAEALTGGSDPTVGTNILLGGRPNSGKTLLGSSFAVDVLLSDPDAIVGFHLTDDTYFRMLPRFKTLIAEQLRQPDEPKLSVGMAATPSFSLTTPAQKMVYERASKKLRELLRDGKLFLLDNEDGPILSVLDRQLKYIRGYDSTSKLLVLADGAHNYRDWSHLDQNTKMKNIAEMQMDIVIRNKCAMLCTAEYRKNLTIDPKKIKWPVDDDIADSRALTYRCQIVSHVYNDKNDRADDATIFHMVNGKKKDRLIYYFGKNKISNWKEKMAFDIDPFTVTASPINIDQARQEEDSYIMSQRND